MKLKSNVEYVFRCRGINIFPGVNLVDDKSLLDHPAVKARIEQKVFEVEETKSHDVSSYLKESARKLAKEIPEMYNRSFLEQLLVQEPRSSVKKMIEDQLSKIKQQDD